MDIKEAFRYAAMKHEGQTRKDGTRYIYHPLAVSSYLKEKGYGEDYQIAGLFHDLLEDTDASEEEILAIGGEAVLKAVRLVTKDGRSMAEYIAGCLSDPIAKAVKDADRIHNLSDAMNGKTGFARRYEAETREWYYGRFSKELDEKYVQLRDQVEGYAYVIDSSMDDMSPLYRTCGGRAWKFDREKDRWESADPFFWAEIGDNAEEVREEEAQRIAGTSI